MHDQDSSCTPRRTLDRSMACLINDVAAANIMERPFLYLKDTLTYIRGEKVWNENDRENSSSRL